jgi:hypothetical protein
MPLCQPSVIGPLSELSSSVRVTGQAAGAIVTVLSLPSGKAVAQGTANSGDERLPLIAGVALATTDLLVAVQEFNGEKSDLPTGDLGMGVQPGPINAGDLGSVGIVTHLFECTQYIWVNGAIPGALVQVATDHVIGSDSAYEGEAHLSLSEPLVQGRAVGVYQIAPGLFPGPTVSSTPKPIPPTDDRRLPAPFIKTPMRGCDPAVEVSGVIEGARVTLRHDDGSSVSVGFDRETSWLVLPKRLEEGDVLTLQQEVFKGCERPPQWSAGDRVGPLEPVDPPVVRGPLCEGTPRIRLEQLRPGAAVYILANGTEYRGDAPFDRTWSDFTIPALRRGSVSARQVACGVSSRAFDPPIDVDPHTDDIPPPVIVGPLYECAQNVSVKDAHPGATVQVFARRAGREFPISDLFGMIEAEAAIEVSPFLRLGDDVFVAQWACSDRRANSDSEQVQPHPAIGPVAVDDDLWGRDVLIAVADALPGAMVEVYVTRSGATAFAGRALATALSRRTIVRSSSPLQPDDTVFATQTLCNMVSEPGRRAVVGPELRFEPRPFYIIGHDTNTYAELMHALAQGANALEPDVNVYDDDPGRLCISHGTGGSGTISLEHYLDVLHAVALAHPELALVVFDCKPPAAHEQHGATLLDAIRSMLTFDTQLNIVLSVAHWKHLGMFNLIRDNLGPREGLMCDEDNDPVFVSRWLDGLGVTNHGFGNGITPFNRVLGPNVMPSIGRACALRATINRPKYIETWTVQDDDDLREYIHVGVDGIITDTVGDLRNITAESEFQSVIRLARRHDNPFRPANLAYALEIHTGNRWMAGTDANVTFTITGQNGNVSYRIDTRRPGRMERNDWNYLTVPSSDLGPLQSITVRRDSQGNAPDWFLDRIRVRSFRFGVDKTAVFNRWIDKGTFFYTAALV